MSETHWDTPLDQPIKLVGGRALRTLREAYDFVRDRAAAPSNSLTASTLNALRAAAASGTGDDRKLAFGRVLRLFRANRWS